MHISLVDVVSFYVLDFCSEIKLCPGNSCGSVVGFLQRAVCWSTKCLGLHIDFERGVYGNIKFYF